MDRLFLGIADTNYCAFIVVGDSSGEILSTGVGGSINHRRWGIKQARRNLQTIIETVGGESGSRIAAACFTYIKGQLVTKQEMLPIVTGLMEGAAVQVADFATTATLGIHSPKERVFLMGDHLGLAILQSEGGQRHEVRCGEPLWNNTRRREADVMLQGVCSVCQEWEEDLRGNERCLLDVAQSLDSLIEEGDYWALGVACDIACNLVRLVGKLGNRFSRPDPVIGFYGPLLLGSETIRQRVQYLLEILFPDAEVMDTPLAPAKGAYLSSLLTRKKELKQEVLTTFYNSAHSVMQRGWLDFVADN